MKRIEGDTFLSLVKKNPYLCGCWAGHLPQTKRNHILLVERLRDSKGFLLPHAIAPSVTHGIRFLIKNNPSKICFYGQYDCIWDRSNSDLLAIQIAHKLSWAIRRCRSREILLGEYDRPWIDCIELIFRSIKDRKNFAIVDFPDLEIQKLIVVPEISPDRKPDL